MSEWSAQQEKTPLISVIIPVYNVELYLRECLDSVVNQTYTNLEILLVNDGSTDGSGSICREYAAGDQRIRVFDKPNGGQSSARNVALLHAQGDYISFVDSDDWIELNCYETCVGYLRERPELDVLEFRYREYITDGAGGVTISEANSSTLPRFDDTESLLRHYSSQGDGVPPCPWSKVYRREIVQGLLFREGKVFEDIGYVQMVFCHTKHYQSIPNTLYYYRRRAGSTTEMLGERFLNLYENLIDDLEDIKRDFPEYSAICSQLLYIKLREHEYGGWKKENRWLFPKLKPFFAYARKQKYASRGSMKQDLMRWIYLHFPNICIRFIYGF